MMFLFSLAKLAHFAENEQDLIVWQDVVLYAMHIIDGSLHTERRAVVRAVDKNAAIDSFEYGEPSWLEMKIEKEFATFLDTFCSMKFIVHNVCDGETRRDVAMVVFAENICGEMNIFRT